ncbi:MAG: hypothetical protein QNI93_11875 [Kiloniellales bacterium]|nr:hypothetical protein [Kiloniellales bacterium]
MEETDVIKEFSALGKDVGRALSPAPINLNRRLSADAAIEPEPLAPGRLQAAKRSYATRRIALGDAAVLFSFGVRPQAGDLVLARIDRIGHHRRIENPEGRRGQLYVGDEVLLCFGARYASDQFEALVPKRLEPCHMVAGGGIAALCINRHGATRPATQITPIGLVADVEGRILNLKDYALSGARPISARPYTLSVVGTSMNAGKTTTIAGMVRGLSSNGLKVAVGKVTGTGAGGDRWAYVDAGASEVLDFTDFGYASTYKVPADELTALLPAMVRWLAEDRPDVIILELADGLFFSETADLVETPVFAELVDDVVVAASDAMGAEAGVRRLAANAMTPIALAGRMTSSPLAVREAARVLETPIVSLADLTDGAWLPPRLAAPARIPA